MKNISKAAAAAALMASAATGMQFQTAGSQAAETRAASPSPSGASGQTGAQGPVTPGMLERLLARFGGRQNSGGAGGYRNRAGWSTKRYQRHAKKLRNQARNRRACRG